MKALWFCMGMAAAMWPCSNARAQYPAPADEVMSKALTAAAMPRLCGDAGVVAPKVLLGEVAVVSAINVLAPMPKAPNLSDGPIVDSQEARIAAWIIATKDLSAEDAKEQFGLSGDYHSKLDNIRIEMVDYLIAAAKPARNASYHLSADSDLGEQPDENAGRVLGSFFADVLGEGRKTGIRLVCVAKKTNAQPPETSSVTVALRGSIDDLAVPRFQPNSKDVTPAFGKASEAKAAYSDNGVKGEETVSAEIALAVGRQLTSKDAVLGFVHYVHSSTETRKVGDDDDSKDIRAISPGILYRRSVEKSWLYGTAGATVYQTHDLAQDSKLLRAKFFLNDIVIQRKRKKDICGAEQSFTKSLYFDCRWGVFVEVGRVQEAGRSADLAEDEDDDYTGAGFNLGLTLWSSSERLRPFSLSFDYRLIKVFSSELGTKSRFVAELAYKIPNSNVSIAFSRTVGENLETFQEEDLNKLSIGYKY